MDNKKATQVEPDDKSIAQNDDEFALIDVKEAVRLCKFSESMLYKLNAEGRTPKAIRFGRLLRWKRKEFNEWLDAGCPDVGSKTKGMEQ